MLIAITGIAIFTLFYSISSYSQSSKDSVLSAIKNKNYSLKILKSSDLPYSACINLKKYKAKFTYDSNGVPLSTYHNKEVYNPVAMAQVALCLIDLSYKDTAYLLQSEQIAKKLIGISLEKNNTLFFPYAFNFNLHSNKSNVMQAPWYSAMAQGQVLSVYVRLFERTNKKHYLDIAKKVFNSFNTYQNQGDNPWVSYVDKKGYLWLEEYPMNNPNFTLNGMIFAIYGIYDYYRVTKDEKASLILKSAIATIEKYISEFRNDGDISYYCLEHKVMSEKYHMIHVEQLDMLYKITGDKEFQKMHIQFKNDFTLKRK